MNAGYGQGVTRLLVLAHNSEVAWAHSSKGLGTVVGPIRAVFFIEKFQGGNK